LNFVFKINSGYGGPGGRFTPAKIPERLEGGTSIDLGWTHYIDAVDEDDVVWIYFLGPQRYANGVYAIGHVVEIDPTERRVGVEIDRYSATEPLTDTATSNRLSEIVGTWFRQVFVLPDAWQTVPTCTVATTATSCEERCCHACMTWLGLPLIDPEDVMHPPRLVGLDLEMASAYWAVPPLSILSRYDVLPGIRHTSDLFKSFKAGNANLAYPFALGMREAMRRRDVDSDFDALIPIPLSPDKAANGEIHRTRLLATELGTLLEAPVVEALALTESISKRAMQREGRLHEFEARYERALAVVENTSEFERVALIDDVSTRGGTLRVALQVLHASDPDLPVVPVTAAQMILRDVVVDEDRLRP
jgi:hypothetical protein